MSDIPFPYYPPNDGSAVSYPYSLKFFYNPRFQVPTKHVAVEPFPTTEKKATTRNGVLVPINQSELTPLRVVFDSESYTDTQVVYVRTKLQHGSVYAKEIFEVEGKKFILIPEEQVVLVDRTPPPKTLDGQQP